METGTFYPDRYHTPVCLLLVSCKPHNWSAWSFFVRQIPRGGNCLLLPVTGYAHGRTCLQSRYKKLQSIPSVNLRWVVQRPYLLDKIEPGFDMCHSFIPFLLLCNAFHCPYHFMYIMWVFRANIFHCVKAGVKLSWTEVERKAQVRWMVPMSVRKIRLVQAETVKTIQYN